ncbi:condensin complex subunit 2/barren [Blyttiomyces helicus]|uniref:Condensin complex subunit 2 n=1 Tax=Blyttiomyces helicus TaxID=388810 RepID=A0A4P9W9Z8_9FUNG|nr:condensin complex subunit 2/barren [Blyttiomyces helicus]|eukprot:RKO87660.1 condensin complex subunit 2/barren [Blyttiomyces helicus]
MLAGYSSPLVSRNLHSSRAPSALRDSAWANDDESEKRARRQSVAADRNRRKSILLTPRVLAGDSPATPGGPRTPQLADEEEKKIFEEWMKFAADNKINASNSWNFDLIEYFHAMKVLREGDSINFQKASCTLDGCVKVYTSRVDYVDSETKKLLSGLAESSANMTQDGEGDGDDDEGKKRRSTKQVSMCISFFVAMQTNTLETDITKLNIKTLELDYMVDPLFKKTSADFDEGGARGLLLNHLAISTSGKIIFDASDAAQNSETDPASASQVASGDATDAPIDIRKLKHHFHEALSGLWDQAICAPLDSFEFNSSDSAASLPFDLKTSDDAFNYDDLGPLDVDDDDGDVGGGAAYDYGGGDDFNNGDPEGELHVGRASADDMPVGFSFGGSAGLPIANQEEDLFSYFDSALLRNWAGPEHWRSRPVKKDKEFLPENATRKKSSPKVRIDFESGLGIPKEALFARSTASTKLPKTSEEKKAAMKASLLLPIDKRFSSADVLCLFMKRDCRIRFRRKDGSAKVIEPTDDTPPDETFWASHENEGPAPTFAESGKCVPASWRSEPRIYDAQHPSLIGSILIPGTSDSPEYDMDDSDVDSDDEDPGDPGFAPAEDAMDFGEQLVEKPLKTRAVPLNYARVAKKVDVRKLKENIWKKLTGAAPSQEETTSVPSSPSSAAAPEKVSGTLHFSQVVRGLDAFYPEKKRKDISAAFCFICVLHLANEHNLRIAGDGGMRELAITQG